MNLRDLIVSPKKTVRSAIVFLAASLVLILACVFWPRIPFLVAHLSPNGNEFFRGLFFGLAIALGIGGAGAALNAKNSRDQNTP